MEKKKRKLYRGQWAGLSVSYISRVICHDYRTTLKYLKKRKLALGRDLEPSDLGLFIIEHYKDALHSSKPKTSYTTPWFGISHLL